MATLKVTSTRDVPLEVLHDLREQLGPDFDLEVNGQVAFFSAEPPSWITFIAQGSWWIQALSAYAALYVAEIVKEAGKDTWKNRGKTLAALRGTSDGIKRFASGIANVLSRLRPNTRAIVGVPLPDKVYSTQLYLSSQDEDELAVEIAMFVHHLPALTKLIEAEGLTSGRASEGVGLTLLQDGSLEVRWFDEESLVEVRRVISFQKKPKP